MTETIAKRLFDAHIAEQVAEADLYDLLSAAGVPWEDYSADWYDGSIELFGTGLQPTAEALAALRAAGFDRAWLHADGCEPSRGNNCKCRSVVLLPPPERADQ